VQTGFGGEIWKKDHLEDKRRRLRR